MLRISKLTDYATVILARLAVDPARRATAAQLARDSGIGTPTVSKLLKQLHHGGLVVSTRGLRGGYVLARPAEAISAADILDALEGPFALTDCAGSTHRCDIETRCAVGSAWQRVNVAIRHSLMAISLAELAGLAHGPRPAARAVPVTLGAAARMRRP